MKGIREIKNRIRAVNSTKQITRAMQLVAASKMKRAQDKAKLSRPYSALLTTILNSLVEHAKGIEHPLLEDRKVINRGILVFSTDKGLCGPLNTNLFRLLSNLGPSAKFVTVGRKATQFFSRTKSNLIADFSVSDHCNFSEVRIIVEFMIKEYLEGNIDTIEVAFPRFHNTLIQMPYLESVLPLTALKTELAELEQMGKEKDIPQVQDNREMHFEPSAPLILSELLDLYIKQKIFQMALEAKASEHSARMVAMKTATENADELSRVLKLEYNKVRQAAITQEILEIAAAAGN